MVVTQAYDGEFIAEIPLDDATTIEEKLDRASRAFASRANWLASYKRIECLRRLALAVENDSDMFATLIAREGGKPITDARIEVARAINGILSACASLEHLAGSEVPMGLTPASQDRWAFTTREPIGVVVAISAFNHPLNLIVHQVVPAIAAGCPVIVKPSSVTALCCLCLVDLAHASGIPEHWCQTVVVEDNALAEKLATDPRVAFLSFIGSAKVGWHLRSKLAPGTRCALEHGGVAPVLIDKSANLEFLIGPLVKGGYYHAGQVCVSTQRIFVHEALYDDFAYMFTERVRKLRVGDPMLPETEVGPLILPREVNRIESWVREAVTLGGRLATGGSRIGERLFQPTVVIEPSSASLLSRQEAFGPVTAIFRFTDLSEAIERANSLPFAFHASVFANDISAALAAASSLNASAVMVNEATVFRTDWMPFAGWGQSSLGVGGIGHTMLEMTREKMIVLKRPTLIVDGNGFTM
jgi:acyl-CoA reductase-like NAD-dependent aldehyde dehydrogenase